MKNMEASASKGSGHYKVVEDSVKAAALVLRSAPFLCGGLWNQPNIWLVAPVEVICKVLFLFGPFRASAYQPFGWTRAASVKTIRWETWEILPKLEIGCVLGQRYSERILWWCFWKAACLQEGFLCPLPLPPPPKQIHFLGLFSSSGSLMHRFVFLTLLTGSIQPLLSASNNNEVALLSGLWCMFKVGLLRWDIYMYEWLCFAWKQRLSEGYSLINRGVEIRLARSLLFSLIQWKQKKG